MANENAAEFTATVCDSAGVHGAKWKNASSVAVAVPDARIAVLDLEILEIHHIPTDEWEDLSSLCFLKVGECLILYGASWTGKILQIDVDRNAAVSVTQNLPLRALQPFVLAAENELSSRKLLVSGTGRSLSEWYTTSGRVSGSVEFEQIVIPQALWSTKLHGTSVGLVTDHDGWAWQWSEREFPFFDSEPRHHDVRGDSFHPDYSGVLALAVGAFDSTTVIAANTMFGGLSILNMKDESILREFTRVDSTWVPDSWRNRRQFRASASLPPKAICTAPAT